MKPNSLLSTISLFSESSFSFLMPDFPLNAMPLKQINTPSNRTWPDVVLTILNNSPLNNGGTSVPRTALIPNTKQ